MKRLASLSHETTAEFLCSSFSIDSKIISALTGDPDRQIVVWQWEKDKVIKTIALSAEASRLRSAPSSSIMLTTSGPSLLKCWYVSGDGTFKTANLLPPARENENFIEHLWLPSSNGVHKMLVLTQVESDGHVPVAPGTAYGAPPTPKSKQSVMILEGANAHGGGGGGAHSTSPPIAMELRQTLNLKMQGEEAMLTGFSPTSKGFVVVGSCGFVSYYERTDDRREPYIEVRHLTLGALFLSGVSLLPSEEKLILISQSGRVLSVPVEMKIDSAAASEDPNDDGDSDAVVVSASASDFSFGGSHAGPIISSDIAQERSIMITICSADASARVWNFETKKCELVHDFKSDDPLSVAVHNSGFQVYGGGYSIVWKLKKELK